MRYWTALVFAASGALLIAASFSLPSLRSANSPMSQHVEPYYLSHALDQTGTPNLVSAILADYRSYDTFGETTVIFAAGLGCYLLLRRFH